jgi:toxic protein SymE
MPDANLKAGPAVTERFVTVQQCQRECHNWHKPSYQPTEPPPFPWLKLAGRWIEQAGFIPGQRVRNNVEYGRLLITAE